MPAFVKSSVGSSAGTSGELGTIPGPLFAKYLRKDARISLEVIGSILMGVRPAAPRIAMGHLCAPKLDRLHTLPALSAVTSTETEESRHMECSSLENRTASVRRPESPICSTGSHSIGYPSTL